MTKAFAECLQAVNYRSEHFHCLNHCGTCHHSTGLNCASLAYSRSPVMSMTGFSRKQRSAHTSRKPFAISSCSSVLFGCCKCSHVHAGQQWHVSTYIMALTVCPSAFAMLLRCIPGDKSAVFAQVWWCTCRAAAACKQRFGGSLVQGSHHQRLPRCHAQAPSGEHPFNKRTKVITTSQAII